jgi:hypothetical protein
LLEFRALLARAGGVDDVVAGRLAAKIFGR